MVNSPYLDTRESKKVTAKGFTASSKGNLRDKFLVSSLTMFKILVLANLAPSTSPSIVTLTIRLKMSLVSVISSTISSSFPISTLTSYSWTIGFKYLPPGPIIADLNLEGTEKVIFTGLVNFLMTNLLANLTSWGLPVIKKVLFLVC